MSLFTALLPPVEVVESLRHELAHLGSDEGDEIRWVPPGRWHITLGFYGERGVPANQAEWLGRTLVGHTAPRVRLGGAGTFPGVLWLSVSGEGLHQLAAAAGAGQEGREYRPHLTLGRWPRERPQVAASWQRRLAEYRGEPWTAEETVLMRSDRTESGSPYQVIETFTLGPSRCG